MQLHEPHLSSNPPAVEALCADHSQRSPQAVACQDQALAPREVCMPQQCHDVLEHSDTRLVGDLLEQAAKVGVTHLAHACSETKALGCCTAICRQQGGPRQTACAHTC